ncbi:hypothetical protein EP227_06875 [bacterium]|nr:MAG: hypothetical protein EP227_06875 [bacterium]
MNQLSACRKRGQEMETKIEDYILKATNKCKNNFSCLDGKKNCMCKIIHSNNYHTVQIDGKPVNACNYILSMGSKMYCLCPVRNELYNRYKI